MKLEQIVETTFLPPPVVRTGISTSEVFEYKCIKSDFDNSFFPCFSNQNTTFYVQEDAEDASFYRSERTIFSSVKQLNKHCWTYFRKTRDIYFKPKVEKNET